MRGMKRILAMLLAVVMVVGLIPATVFAASDNVDYLFLATDRHTNTSIIGNIINNMESTIGENKLDYLGLGGDMVGSGDNHPAYNSSTVLAEVTGATSSLSATNVDIVAGVHDTNVTDDAGIVLPFEGGGAEIYEGDKFYVYGVEESCIAEEYDSEWWESEAQKFVDWATGTNIDKSKVIVVLSHYPLHAKRDDNDGAYYWHQALNTVATGGDTTVERNVFFFHGHNHTKDSNEYVYDVGDTMEIQNGSSTTSDTIYYTYATAGYLNQNSKATLMTITDDAVTLTKYTTSGSGTAMTSVDRVSTTPTLSSIAVSGTTEYYVGDELDLTVTATYSDGNTADVTVDATLSGYDMSTAGTYTVTATYEGQTATTSITVAEPYVTRIEITADPTKTVYDQGDELDTTGMVVTAIYNNGTTAVVTPTSITGYDMSVVGQQTVKVNYYVDGYTYSDTFTITVNQAIADDATLTKIEITTDLARKEYQVNDALDISGMVVEATFSDGTVKVLEYDALNSEDVDGYILDGFSMYVEKAHEVKVSYTYKDVTCSDTTTINVWNYKLSDETTGVTVEVADEDYGVTAVNVAISTNTNVESAIGNYISTDNYKAYDITLTLDTDGKYALTNGEKTVTLPIPEGVNNPVVYYVSDDGKTVENMNAAKDGNGNVTFTTTHFSTYVIGESTEITVPDNQTQTNSTTTDSFTSKTVYVLVTEPENGEEYLIVSNDYALVNNSGSATGVAVTDQGEITIDGTTYEGYIELDNANAVWTAGTGWTFKNGSYYLYHASNSGSVSLNTSSATWNHDSSNNRLSYSYTSSNSGGNNRPEQGGGSGSTTTQYLYYGSSGWSVSSQTQTNSGGGSSRTVYFYKEVTYKVDNSVTKSGTYAIDGEDLSVPVSEGSTANLTSTLTFTPDANNTATVESPVDVSTTATYEIVTVDAYGSTVDGDPNDIISTIENGKVTFTGSYGTALVKVTYPTDFGDVTDYITIEAKAPYYSINLHKAELTEAEDVTADNFANGTYYIFDSVTNTYDVATEYEEGTTYYTTPVVQGAEITETVALKGIEAGDTYAVWAVVMEHTAADPDGKDLGTLGDALTWSVSDESIATIDTETGVITFTGKNYGTFTVTVAYEGADGKVITDTITISATESLYVVPGDGTDDFPEYPDQGAVRFDKTATAVGNYSETGIAMVELSMTGVPYTTGSELDVVVMLDMSTSMDDDRIAATVAATKVFIESIVKNEDGSYNSNRVYVGYFNGDTVYTITGTDNIGGELASVDNDTEYNALIAAIEDEYDGALTASGTNYDVSLEECYNVLTEAKSTNLPPEAETAADYSRQQFVVFMSDGGPTDYATSASNVVTESTIVDWFNVSDSDSANWTNSMTEEYWSGLMKDNGVTIYSVGLILQEAPTSGPQDYRDYSADQNYYVTSTLLTSIASGADYFFNCESSDDTTEMESIFSNIATEIHEAATNVVVEDKIGSSYTMNFSLPGYNTDNQLDSTALDGLSNFYIQVVDYVLDSTTHERTDTYTVLENFTFNLDGSLKSHTVDGAACGDTCSHVTTTDGVITAIDGTYFDYKSDSTGEYLTWTAEKLNENELALQYFAYLDNSSGVAEADQIPAGTYYTNEYATLTYTNVNGNQVQQEFPVPQMTWYGAQVSYVFYLVNEAGQPVNRAGRVVPFAEAVYVTDVYTEAVVWNDLEQSAGLEAERLAEELVPDVYALYDNDASYNIHVYADEDGVNLNNHFVIGGDVTDDYNTATNSWTNAKTTYVFNNKSDGTKYNIVGAYIANDGSDTTTTTTYLCKGEGTISDVTWGEVTLTSDSDLVNGAYYYDVNGVKTRALTYVEGTTYYELTGASYTAVSGETQWTPGSEDSTTGGTKIGNYVYYVDENGEVYTIVQKSDGTEVREGFDFANTTVAFAVVWQPQLEEDTVVVDFGLDVVVDVVTNDALASGVVGVRTDAPSGVTMNSGTYTSAKATSVDVYIDANSDDAGLKELKIGTATVENLNAIRFSLDKTNGMQFSEPAVFYYEADVNYYDDNVLQTTSMYSSVTVIPATTVYYEDTFVTLEVYDNSTKELTTGRTWEADGTAKSAVQDVDRPGVNKLSDTYDSDNVYGYDSAYETVATHSMGSAMKLTVDSAYYGEAKFTFYGTGFDVISMTSNQTGTILVQVADESGEIVRNKLVDTYYGYTKDQEGEWVTSVNDPNAIYQVPVITVEGLDYGKYTVTITAAYNKFFAHNGASSYDIYLDAIRIYDPVKPSTAVGDKTIEDIYKADNEGWPSYMELRDMLLTATDFEADLDTTVLTGAMFIDGISSLGDAKIADYTSYGPNNEVYLAPGQGVAFTLTSASYVHVGMRRMTGTATYTIESYDEDGNLLKSVTGDVTSATDMYYDITDLKDGTIVIRNSGESGELMITNLKYTFESNPADAQVAMFMTMRRSTAVLGALNSVDTDSDKTDDTVTGETETGDTVVEDTNNTETGDTVVEDTNNTETGDTVVEDTNNTENDDTGVEDTANTEPAEDIPEEEIPEEENPEEDTPAEEETTEEPVEQLGFWARLWNAIKNAFNRLFSWFGF